ncbi:hypothetical protein ACROYT_G010424 [Oculina patagonica]
MVLLHLLTVFVLANALDVALSCGGGSPPTPCSWTVCRSEFRNDWAPGGQQGKCVEQIRRAHEVNNPHHGSGSCPAPQPCGYVPPQHRLYCSCRSGTCALEEWSQWAIGTEPNPGAGACGYRRRTRSYTVIWSYKDVIGPCGPEVQPGCPPAETETKALVC